MGAAPREEPVYPTMHLIAAAAAIACLAALAGCAGEKPQSTFTHGLDTGITSSDGGGQRALGNTVDLDVTTRTQPASPASGRL